MGVWKCGSVGVWIKEKDSLTNRFVTKRKQLPTFRAH